MLRLPQIVTKKLRGPAPVLLFSLVLMVAFQNFSPLNQPTPNSAVVSHERVAPESQPLTPKFAHDFTSTSNQIIAIRSKTSFGETDSPKLVSLNEVQNASAPGSRAFDIRVHAPGRPAQFDRPDPFRAPEVHSYQVGDVGTVWLEREVRPIVKPLEDEWLREVNGRLRGLVGTFKPVESEEWPEPGDEEGQKRGPASEPGGFPGMPSFPGMPDLNGSPSGESDQTSEDHFSLNSFAPEDVKLTKANELTIGFKHGTNVSCEVGSGQSKFRLSRPFSRSSSIDISHESAENRNSVGFRLSW